MESYGKLWRIRRQLSDLAQRCSRMFKDVFKDVQSQTCESHVAFPVSSSSSSSSASSKSASEMQATEAFASALAHVALALKFQRYSQREIRKTFIFMILTIFTPVFLAFPWHFFGVSVNSAHHDATLGRPDLRDFGGLTQHLDIEHALLTVHALLDTNCIGTSVRIDDRDVTSRRGK